jgi:hypothetical protein
MGVIDRHEHHATLIGALSGMERHGLSRLPAPVAVAVLLFYAVGFAYGLGKMF